jgi:Ca-activated chloride channel family protein
MLGGPMSFRSPWFLLALLLLAVAAGIWVLAERRRMRYAVRFTNVEVLASVVSGRSWRRFVPPLLFALSLAFLLVGLARPEVSRMLLKERATVILVADTSRSMQAKDVQPTRLGAAQESMRLFLERVPDRLRVGLVVFAGEAQVATPPTRDHDLVRTAVDEIDTFLVYGGTAIGDALATAVELGRRANEGGPPEGEEIALGGQATRSLAQAAGCEQGPVSILFLSDGAQTRGALQPHEGAALAKDACIPVYTIALGTPNGVIEREPFGYQGGSQLIPVPPDPETLRQIAETTGGEFSEARTADALEKAYESLGSRLGREPGQSEITFLFVAIAGGLLLLAGVFSALFAPRLP